MTGKLCISELQIPCQIGVSAAERAQPQPIWVNIELELQFPLTDELEATVDYAALAARVKSFCTGRAWKLIETLARELAELLLRETTAAAVSVEVKKAVLPDAKHVSAKVLLCR
ncbi:MAG: dihydroneopterin aldolase [Verrucomicrobiae bacterium]|nr:dihydroneopterin aldolase [Verrucomicrobiae bacterium]MCX7723492.1 dihydroneopterin aldolase [Verrucomicrobiae bacterium]MDW7980423.1 dihydroneopterin aldolase [Verrucomicrobiales bacterium]